PAFSESPPIEADNRVFRNHLKVLKCRLRPRKGTDGHASLVARGIAVTSRGKAGACKPTGRTCHVLQHIWVHAEAQSRREDKDNFLLRAFARDLFLDGLVG